MGKKKPWVSPGRQTGDLYPKVALDERPLPSARLAFKKGTLDGTNIPPMANRGHKGRELASSPKVQNARSWAGANEKQRTPPCECGRVGGLPPDTLFLHFCKSIRNFPHPVQLRPLSHRTQLCRKYVFFIAADQVALFYPWLLKCLHFLGP